MSVFKRFRINWNKEIEPQEIFLDKLAEKKEEEIGITENRVEIPLSKKVVFGIFLFFASAILFLFSQTAYLQIVKGNELTDLARNNKFAIGSIKAERGVIYDQNGKQLVYNEPSFDLIGDESEISADSIRQVSQITGIAEADIKERISKNDKIAESIDHDTLIILETKINNLPGFKIENNSTRYYQDGQYFSQIIGYTGKLNKGRAGKDGIEKSYDDVLKENPGKIQIEKDVYGNLLSKEILSLPESGKSLVLWLDSDLQKKAEEELIKVLEKTGAKKAVAVAMDPQTGGILSLVSLPSYDNNLFTKGASQEEIDKVLKDLNDPMLDRAISGLYPTGSTIKPFLANAALEENLISPDKRINDIGYIEVRNKYDPNIVKYYRGIQPHGWVNMRQAIAVSSNIYFYTIGGGYGDQTGLGPTRIKKYLELAGWGNKTNIDLPGETCGFIPDPDWKKKTKGSSWTDGDTYNMSIGQGDLLMTPIEVAWAYAAIANGGTLHKPKIVKQIVDENKNVIQEIKPEAVKTNLFDPDNLKVIREGMRMAVTAENAPQASSYLLNFLPVSAAAKTGTAETPYKDKYINWINVFAPYDNPKILLTIMIENVPGVQAATLPAAQGILNWYFSR